MILEYPAEGGDRGSEGAGRGRGQRGGRRLRLVVATGNRGKMQEYRELLAGLPLELRFLPQLGLRLEVAEGDDYAANARRKALAAARASGLPSLADDSGIEVAALSGAPGPRSARLLGEAADDLQRCREILRRLSGVPLESRRARFVCALALAVPGGPLVERWGELEGLIALQPRGGQGFGYDPIFLLPERDATLAELGREVKNRISHRARAVEGLRPFLEELARGGARSRPPPG